MAKRSRWQKLLSAGAADGLVAGLEYAGLVAVFVVIGIFIDNALNTGSLFVVIFAIFGFAGGFLRLYYAQQYDEARRVFRGLPPKPQREVPDVLEDKQAERDHETGPKFDTLTGITSFKDWKPRKFGEPLREEQQQQEKLRDETSAPDESSTAEGAEPDEYRRDQGSAPGDSDN